LFTFNNLFPTPVVAPNEISFSRMGFILSLDDDFFAK